MQEDSGAVIRTNPEFQGGLGEYYKYLSKKFVYPRDALNAGYAGEW